MILLACASVVREGHCNMYTPGFDRSKHDPIIEDLNTAPLLVIYAHTYCGGEFPTSQLLLQVTLHTGTRNNTCR